MPSKSNNPEILQLIHREHEEVQALFEQFQESRAAGEDVRKAQSIAEQIFTDLKLHTELEEKIVYSSLKEQDEKVFYEAGEEHHVVDMIMEELQRMKVSSPEYAAKMTVMEENVKHHIEEEEGEMFDLIKQLPEDTLSDMSQQWKKQKQQAQKAGKG